MSMVFSGNFVIFAIFVTFYDFFTEYSSSKRRHLAAICGKIETKIDLSFSDASDLFEDSVENNQELEVRRSSRHHRSGATANKSIVTTTTTTVDPNGHVHSTAVLESQDLPEMVLFYFLKKILKVCFHLVDDFSKNI